jgi:Putative Flp pilus-assembly TadE/G-like/von Willebrand factor type A domain
MFRIRSRAGRTFVGPSRAALRRTFTSPERTVMRRSVVALLRPKPSTPARRDGERGQVIVLFTFFIVVLLGFAAIVVDLGVLRNANQNLWNALDSGALAGAMNLPADGNAAKLTGMQYADSNYPGTIPPGRVTQSFRCLIGDRNHDNLPDLSDIPMTCNPGVVAPSAWRCGHGICTAPCDPAEGDTCNTLVMTGSVSVPFRFGGAVGVNDGDTQVVTSAACKGPCGSEPVALVDVALVVDRTSSMSGVDTTNARNAADSVRKLYNPAAQWLSFGMLGPSQVGSGSCSTTPASAIGSAGLPTDLRRWVPVGLSGAGASFASDYSAATSPMAKAIACFTNSSTGTDLTDPIPMASYELLHNGRSGVNKGIILMSDGQPNNSTTSTSNYCLQANTAATAAKAQGIEIFTVGFGLDGSNDIACPDTSGAWKGKMASALLASMATTSVAEAGCPTTENTDNDHYFCVPKTAGASADLSNAFKTAATSLAQGTKLVELP